MALAPYPTAMCALTPASISPPAVPRRRVVIRNMPQEGASAMPTRLTVPKHAAAVRRTPEPNRRVASPLASVETK